MTSHEKKELLELIDRCKTVALDKLKNRTHSSIVLGELLNDLNIIKNAIVNDAFFLSGIEKPKTVDGEPNKKIKMELIKLKRGTANRTKKAK